MAGRPLPEPMSDTLSRVASALEGAGYEPVLVGALAAWAWAHPRTTGDLDLVVLAEPTEEPRIEAALRTLGWPVHGPEHSEFGRRFRVEGPLLPVEVFVAPPLELQRRERDRAVSVELGARTHRVLSPEDFVLRKLVNMKLRADPHDRTDALATLVKNWDRFDFEYVRRNCGPHRVCGRFEAFAEEARRIRADQRGGP